MVSLEVERIVAAFLDSPEARRLGMKTDLVRRFALLLAGSSFDDLGVLPRFLDDQQLDEVISLTARKLGRGDALAAAGGRILRAFFDHVLAQEHVPHAYELGLRLDGIEERFERLTAAIDDDQRVAGETKTIANRAAKVGRNEPCPCGSGKKFKQCCGRGV